MDGQPAHMAQPVMIIRHPAVTSDVFKLISTVEFDLEIHGHFLPTRIELFQNTERDGIFRCRLWERDLFRLQSSPQHDAGTGPQELEATDEEVLVERTWELSDSFECFEADSTDHALRLFIDAIENFLRRIPGGAGNGKSSAR